MRGFAWAVAVLALAGSACAQTITQIATVPAGIRVTNQGTIQATFTLTGFTPPVSVQFQRDDFATDTISGQNNGPGTITLVLSDLPASDGRLTTYNVVASDAATPPNVRTVFNALSFRYDNIPPAAPNIASPTFPATIFGDSFQIRGTVFSKPPAPANTPVTTGTVLVTLANPPNTVIGAGALTNTPPGTFIATVDVSRITTGVPTQITIRATDEAGNAGDPLTVTFTRQVAPPPTFPANPTCQPAGQLTNNPAVLVRGTVTGTLPPFTVNFFIDGVLNSQISGLANNEAFAHTLNLPSDGAHQISVQAANSNQPPDRTRAVIVCSFTLDTRPPGPPVITQPNPTLASFVTSGPTFVIEGISTERAFCTTSPTCPRPSILAAGPAGVTFNPASPITPNDTSGQFRTTVTLPQTLIDGRYSIRLTSVDAAGNTSAGSLRDVIFDLDRTAPTVTEVRINNVIAPQSAPEIFVGRNTAAVSVRTSEALVNVPTVTFTQTGASAQSLGFTSSTASIVFNYQFTAQTGRDGPVNAAFTVGRDAAGNVLNQTIQRLFIVDTTPPRVASVTPSDRTTVGRSPNPIRVVLEDPLDTSGLASGVDTSRTQVVVEGPLTGNTGPAVNGTLIALDPRTVDFIPNAPLTADGVYRVTVTPVDRAGNQGANNVTTFLLDTTPIALRPGLIECTPRDGAFVNPTTIPGTSAAPFVTVKVNSPDFNANLSLIEVNDFCRVPPRVPGAKQVVSPDTISYRFAGPLATDGSQDGTYAMAITLADSVGNLSPQTFCTFIYDSLTPLVDRTFPQNGGCTNGPMRIVDATLVDPAPDSCRARSGIDRRATTLQLFLTRPNPFSNSSQPREIRGVLRFESVGNVDKVLLQIVDKNNVPVGLKADGTDDGQYELRVRAVDRAGNRSEITTASFGYDTRPPELFVDKIKDGDALAGTSVMLTGNVRDNAGGGDVDRVSASLISVDARGAPTTSVPFFANVTAALNPLAEPNSGTPPRRTWTLSAPMQNTTTSTRARLTVTAFDKCGNFRDIGYTVQVLPGRLAPPQLSRPLSLSCTSTQIVDFAWIGVTGANGYELRIQTPKGNVLTQRVDSTRTSLRVNLGQQGDGDGQYLFSVAALDGGMQLGSFARNAAFFIDTTPPRVLAVDAMDPSPESRGVLIAGETRFTITFNESMKLASGLNVQLAPENRSIPPLPVTTVTFSEAVWTGRVVIPQNGAREPDYNGLGELVITGGRDCAGNLMATPDHGLVVFEINTGPLLKIAFFQNPIDDRDLIVLLKGFTREGGPATRLIDAPVLTFNRQGEREQAPRLIRINDSTFQGLFRLNTASSAPIQLIATARDEGGNTATRTITLNVITVAPGEALVVQPSTAVRLELPQGAVRGQTSLLALPRTFDLVVGSKIDVPEDGALVPVAAVDQVSPLGIRFAEPARLIVDTEKLATVQNKELLPKAGLYQRTAAGWEWLPQMRAGTQLVASVRALHPLALLHDAASPQVHIQRPLEGAKLDPGDPAVEADVIDRGSGLDPESLKALLDGKPVPVKLDAAAGRARADLAQARPGEHELVLAVADRAGNVTRATRRLVAVPAFGLSEVVPFPNPARTSSRIRYRLAGPVDTVDIRIYDVSGRLVRLLAGDTGAGRQTVEWPLDTGGGDGVANGVYLVRVTASGGGHTAHARTRIAVLR